MGSTVSCCDARSGSKAHRRAMVALELEVALVAE